MVVGGFRALCRGLGWAGLTFSAVVVVVGLMVLLARACEVVSRLG